MSLEVLSAIRVTPNFFIYVHFEKICDESIKTSVDIVADCAPGKDQTPRVLDVQKTKEPLLCLTTLSDKEIDWRATLTCYENKDDVERIPEKLRQTALKCWFDQNNDGNFPVCQESGMKIKCVHATLSYSFWEKEITCEDGETRKLTVNITKLIEKIA